MAFFHTPGQDIGAIGFPLHVTDGRVGISEGELEPELDPSNPGA